MKDIAKVQIAAGVLAACFNLGGGAAIAAPSLSQPGQEVEKELPRPEAEVVDSTPEKAETGTTGGIYHHQFPFGGS